MTGLPALLRFVVVGFLSLVVDVGSLWVLHGLLHVPLALATALAYGVAFFVNFFVNRAWTFRAPTAGRRALVRYGLVVALNLAAVEVGVLSLVRLGLDYRIARAACTAAMVPVNFVLMRRFVFHAAPPAVSVDGLGLPPALDAGL